MTTAPPAATDFAPLIISLDEDQIAELADLLAWINDADGNDPSNYPNPGWDDPDATCAWSAEDRWLTAPE